MSLARSAAALLLAAALAGCAALSPDAVKAPAAPAPQVLLSIEAPAESKKLLETYLDLARLSIIAPGEALSETELRRLEAATPAQARALLATQGYMDPVVQVQREAGDSVDALPRVRVQVTPGLRSRITRADLELQGPLAEAVARGDEGAKKVRAAWRAAWRLPVDAAFTDNAWREAKAAALARLRADGYANATWSGTSAQVDADASSVQITVVAESGPLYRTGALLIRGLQRQEERHVRNLAGFDAGTPATEALLLDYQERLQRAGLFEQVSVTLASDPEQAAAAAVTVTLRELPLQQALAGIGISATNGPRVSLEHLHRRPFGQAATLRNKVEIGRVRQAWEGDLSSHTLPGFERNVVGGTAERLESDTDRVSSLRARVGRAFDGQRVERLAFVELERELVRPFASSAQTEQATADTTTLSANLHGVWRDVDSMILPTTGRSLSVQTALGRVRSSEGGQGSGSFARAYGRLQLWHPLGANWYGQARLELGQVFAADAVDVPESQRFRAGGDDSVRGYTYRSLTPKVGGVDVGGRVLATGSIEVARPISAGLPSLWWAAFIDAGRAADSWRDWSPAWGAGLGLRWRSPVGPLRVDLAYGEEVKRWRLHLSVGIAF
ncbi:MAG: BamA/TamA family outer membrane protein [Pseudomonadota bacterium]